MPLYAFRCADEAHHEFERHCKMDGSDLPTRCPIFLDRDDPSRRCDAAVTKVFSAPSRHFPGADSWRSKNGA
jgi:hypothetical protein